MIPKQSLDISISQNLLTRHQQAFDMLAQLLIRENERTNLTRITELNQIRIRHFLDSLSAAPLLDELAQRTPALRIADIGSGAGFPVLPLAIVRPNWKFISIEGTGKKAAFQNKAAAELGLDNVSVIHGRAEMLAHEKLYREQFDAVVVRAVAELRILAELSLAFVKVGGKMLAFKGAGAEKELNIAGKTIAALGGQAETVRHYTLSDAGDDFCLIPIAKIASTPDKYPRSYSVISRKSSG